MAQMFLCTGILGFLICISGILIKDIHHLEEDIPDFDVKAAKDF